MYKMNDVEYDEDDDLSRDYNDSCNSSTNSLVQPLLSSENSSSCRTPSKIPLTATLLVRNTKLAKVCVMLTVMLERAAYYSLLGNLALYLNAFLGYSSGTSIILTIAFSSLTWISCFLGGILGDIVLGRFKTIITGILLYVVGFTCLVFLTKNSGMENSTSVVHVIWLAAALLTISLGEGCFKSNMSPFGADQLNEGNETRSFFNYFYWFMNIGSLLGYSLLTWVQQEQGFIIGYLVPTCLLALAFIVFIIPRPKNYHVLAPNQKTLNKLFKICCNSKRKKSLKTSYETFSPIRHWLDRAKIQYGGKFSDTDVEEVKMLLNILPILGFLIIYCICYYQIQGTFLLQGLHMKLISFGTNKPMPPSWFMLFNIITVLLLVPFIDRYLYPCLGKFGTSAPFMFRMSIGMILGTFGMVAAGVTEYFRLKNDDYIINELSFVNITAVNMTILYQLPQYGLLGLSEIFVMITGLEFAYCQSPKSLQSFATCLFFMANGIGAFLGSIFIAIGNAFGWDIADNTAPNEKTHLVPQFKGNLHYFFFFLAGLNFLNWIAFVIFGTKRTKSRRKKELERTVSAYIQGNLEASLRSSPDDGIS